MFVRRLVWCGISAAAVVLACASGNAQPPGYPGTTITPDIYSTSPQLVPISSQLLFAQAGPGQPLVGYPLGIGAPNNPLVSVIPAEYQRLIDSIFVGYTWLEGDDGIHQLQMYEVELATSFVFPAGYTTYVPLELRTTPGFVFHFLDGPDVAPPRNLPPQLYSVYLDNIWNPQITNRLFAHINTRIGVYSDFSAFNKETIRMTGSGLAVLRISPQLKIKGGVEYLDRVKVKLLPAGGVYWEPNPQTRLDLYFPRPKLSRFLKHVGYAEVWWYVGGEYGGGSWTIEQLGGIDDQIDINDIRLFGGLRFTMPTGLEGFFEAGFVWNREVRYSHVAPGLKKLALDDTAMIRAGLVW